MHRTASFLCAQAPAWVYDENGEPVTPGGKDLTEDVAAALAAGGCLTSEVEQHEHYGWGFTARLGNDSFYNVLNAVDRDVYFTIEMNGVLLKRLLRRNPQVAFESYCDLVGRALASIDGVSEVRWEDLTR